MKKSEVKKLLDKLFKENLGNDFNKNKHLFIKHFGDIYFDFGIGIVDSDNSFSSSFYFGFGNEKHSNLFNKMISILGLNIQTQQLFTAFGSGQIRLFDEGKYPLLEYDIYTEADAKKMADEVTDYVLRVVLPDWEANPTIEYLEKEVNEKLTDTPNLSGLILAKIVCEPKFDLIKCHSINVSKNWTDGDKKDLDKVISFLDSHSQEELIKLAKS